MKSAKGFTLVEVLVVTAIVSVLAAIIFPVYLNAKHGGNKVRCLSNQRQFAMAIQMYQADDGGIPGVAYPDPWYRVVKPYVRGTLTDLKCPRYQTGVDPMWQDMAVGYALNRCSIHRSAISRAATTVLLTEVADLKVTQPGFESSIGFGLIGYAGKPDSIAVALGRKESLIVEVYGELGALRHRGHSHYTMVDGHTRFLPPSGITYQSRLDECDSTLDTLRGPPNGPAFPLLGE